MHKMKHKLPADPSKTTTAPSITLSVCSTSIVKSICPGVSNKLILHLSQGNVTAAAVIVIPRNE